VWLFWAAGYWVRYTGRENIPPEGAVLVAPNHQSFLDPPLVGAGCPRRMNYLARKSLFHFFPFRWLIDSLDAIPLDTEGIGFGGMKETLRRLRRGEMVLVFPEGSRTWDGEVGPFQPGFTTLAVRGRAAILPVAIEGAFEVWPRSEKLPRLGVVHVHYGVPIPAEDVRRQSEEDVIAEVRRRVCQYQAMLRQRPPFARRRPRSGAGDRGPGT
jgi:1-acyl-sn-glycerol-3-phosphate acyltransferase